MSARWKRAALLLLLVYSVAHFLASAVFAAWSIEGGDVLSAFPGPLTMRVSKAWPALWRDWLLMAKYHNDMVGFPLMWNYGPVVQFLTLPLAWAATGLRAMRILLLVDYGLVAATFILWMRLLLPDRRYVWAWLAILCIWFNQFPLLEAVAGREVEIFEMFLLTLAIWALRNRREALAGSAIGVAAMTKFLPVVFIPYLFVKGYRKAAYVAIGTTGSIALLAQLLLGWQHSLTLFFVTKEGAGAIVSTAYATQAITNVLYKTFTAFNIHDPRPPTLYPNLLHPIGFGLSLLVLVGTARFLVRWRRNGPLEVECALLAIVMCLVPPHANTYYLVFALPALSIGLAALWRRSAIGTRPKLLLAASIALTGFVVPMKAFEIVTGVQGMLVARVLQGWSLPAYGAILAAILMLEVHRTLREQHSVVAVDGRAGRAVEGHEFSV